MTFSIPNARWWYVLLLASVISASLVLVSAVGTSGDANGCDPGNTNGGGGDPGDTNGGGGDPGDTNGGGGDPGDTNGDCEETINETLTILNGPSLAFDSSTNVATVRATFGHNGSSSHSFSDVSFDVVQFDGAGCPCTVLNADGGPGGVGATVSVAPSAYDDNGNSLLDSGEAFEASFQIQLTVRAPFTFFVNARGVPVP
ncbi:MAG: hypothetical protein L0177_01080 [Chloroflexi bacterium]|nr:hypothetical protein [Chloroflexota bacterium]